MARRRKDEPTLSVWRMLFMLLMAIIGGASSGCAASYSTYDAAIAASHDPEQHDAAVRWLERFERDVENADQFFMLREFCLAGKIENRLWLCRGRETYNPKYSFTTLERKVRTYREDRMICGCVERRDIF